MSSSKIPIPAPVRAFFALFPLHTYPPVPCSPATTRHAYPTLWIYPSAEPGSPLSGDVECLKWQAYLALRGLKTLRTRSDVSPEGAVDSRLPNLHVSREQLLAAHHIPSWADSQLPPPLPDKNSDLEGYKDEVARDESRAWVSLLEGNVHAALALSTPEPSYVASLLTLAAPSKPSLESLVTTPVAPLTGFTSLFPPSGSRVSRLNIYADYREAMSALSDRLGNDTWFLGSSQPTPLDALAFAYLHTILDSPDSELRIEVSRHANLVSWEQKVRRIVQDAYIHEK